MIQVGPGASSGDVLASAALFSGLSPEQLAGLARICQERRYGPGELILREGSTDPSVYIIADGRAELVKQSTLGDDPLRIGELRRGDVVGELQIVDPNPSSASVRAVTAVTAVSIAVDVLARAPGLAEAHATVLQNVGTILARRLRDTTGNEADAHYRELAESRARVYAGRFIVLMFGMLASYQLALSALTLVPAALRPPDAILSFVFVLWTVGPVALALRRSPFTLRSYGLTLQNARSDALSAAILTTPLLAGLVLLKLALIRWAPGMADRPLFDPSAMFAGRPFDLGAFLLFAVLYGIHTPLQEFVARGGLQGTLQQLLPAAPGRTNWKAIVISNLLFASAHVYIGFWFCVAAFIPGLFWGWLFSRQRSLVGVIVSHLLVGFWGMFALGVHVIIGGG
jgi:CRP-like cAMP-binding protein/membrane protease YdiL (CAAX protease family)